MNTKPAVDVIIVAAGRGERAGAPEQGPKQYRPAGGRPVIAHTLAVFQKHPAVRHVCIVIHPDDDKLLHGAIGNAASGTSVVHGRQTRQGSVLAGLDALAGNPPDIVLIHDAVRPFVSTAVIDAVISATLATGAAIPAIAVADTLKRADDSPLISGTVDRSGLFAEQTPQGFRFDHILRAHRAAAAHDGFTDDASIAEWAGLPVALVRGDAQNVKLTWAEDLKAAHRIVTEANTIPDIRTGNGYDVHRLGAGDHVTLCGIAIPHTRSLEGHSDADVALHALTDALLATCGAGDIGDHFPPSDPQWRGAPSGIFLRHARDIVISRGGTILNADVSLVAEAPKIAPFRAAMQANLASLLGIDRERCSVKATTNEKMGFVGRSEGIAAIATASVHFGAKS
jgi:2-C-methyl-D-erythritol 4-phosphate cytidylyltransferase/2-C-methyl-D-erythritol 2,4-cyclodiphosphate synthase